MAQDFSNLPPQPGSPPPAKGVRKVVMPNSKNVRTKVIMLEENPDIPPTGQFIGHNGNAYMLKPGIWTEVPLPLIEVLDQAVKMVPVVNPDSGQIIDWRNSLRYPYRVAPGQDAA